jgi:hypothetical protein
MVPVIAAIAAALRGFAIRKFSSGSGKAVGLIGTAEKLLFNIGRIPVRQSRSAHSQRGKGKSCRRAEKGRPRSFVIFAIRS